MSIENPNDTDTNSEEGKAQSSSAAQSAAASAEAAKNALGGMLANFMALKDSNPKVFYGAIGGAVAVVLLLFSSGGSEKQLPVYQAKPIVVGQNYVLKSPNSYDPQATVRLVSVPGSMAAYDDTEEADREGGCKHIAQGSQVKVTGVQDAYGKKDAYAEVEMQAGECQGKRGWTLSINLQ